MASGIKDKVAIVGMGCTAFGEHWDKGPEDLMVEAFEEALADAKIARKEFRPPGWAMRSTTSMSATARFRSRMRCG